MNESDEVERRVARNLRFAEQLDQKRVWGLDDPAVREVPLDPVALRLLDVVSRSTEPVRTPTCSIPASDRPRQSA